MAKKNFIPETNPLLNVLGYDEPFFRPDEVPAAEEKKDIPPEKTEEANSAPLKKSDGRKKPATKGELESFIVDFSSPKPPKPETRSKRLNLLVKPSVLKEVTKIAQKYGISVNELINRLLEACVNNDK